MTYIGISFILVAIWIAFEIWRAPLMEEKEDGTLVTKRPTKKLSDLFKEKNNTYSDLEKKRRGRSKY